MPVRTDLYDEIIEQMNKNSFYTDEGRSGEERKLWREIADSMSGVQTAVLSENLYSKILDYFKPYFKEEASYEECAEKAQQYYDIYRSE